MGTSKNKESKYPNPLEQGLAFDDVLLVPQYSEILPSDVSLATQQSRLLFASGRTKKRENTPVRKRYLNSDVVVERHRFAAQISARSVVQNIIPFLIIKHCFVSRFAHFPHGQRCFMCM